MGSGPFPEGSWKVPVGGRRLPAGFAKGSGKVGGSLQVGKVPGSFRWRFA